MDLVQEARRGAEAAFLQLFDEHQTPLFRFAYRLTGSKADAEDAVQECFLQLLRPACRYDPKRTALRTYLFGVVRNQCLRKMRGRGDVPDFAEEQSLEPSPEKAVLWTEFENVVAQAVAQLPEKQRSVLLLAHYEQLPLGDIAELMELDLGAVKSRLQRARASLKETLAAYAPGPERRR